MLLTALALAATSPCPVELVVLGAGQDAGAPQIANNDDPAWGDPGQRLFATSIAIVDHDKKRRYLFEATPDIRDQLHMLDSIAPPRDGADLGLNAVFLTHAHIGHYAGLMFFGFESANAQGIKVATLPRMADYLAANGPWSQLVTFGNIELHPIDASNEAGINAYSYDEDMIVIPWAVPHRDEFSETAAYTISIEGKTILFVPDVDSLDEWDKGGKSIEEWIDFYDLIFIDSTFFDDNELDRDMSAIPHPRTKGTMDRFADLPPEDRAKVHFIHYNHSNPIRFPDSAESKMVEAAGFNVARRGDRHCLSAPGLSE